MKRLFPHVEEWPDWWRRTVVSVAAFALLSVPVVGGYNIYAWVSSSQDRQNTKILRLQQQALAAKQTALAAQVKAASTYIAGQEAAAKARCQAGVAGTRRANIIIRNLKASLLDLASAVSRKDIARLLRRRAGTFTPFTPPDCSPQSKRRPAVG